MISFIKSCDEVVVFAAQQQGNQLPLPCPAAALNNNNQGCKHGSLVGLAKLNKTWESRNQTLIHHTYSLQLVTAVTRRPVPDLGQQTALKCTYASPATSSCCWDPLHPVALQLG
jgi:hypothetical protein